MKLTLRSRGETDGSAGRPDGRSPPCMPETGQSVRESNDLDFNSSSRARRTTTSFRWVDETVRA